MTANRVAIYFKTADATMTVEAPNSAPITSESGIVEQPMTTAQPI